MIRRKWIGSVVLIAGVVAAGAALAAWKQASLQDASTAAASQPEPTESVAAAVARELEHGQSTTSIGTVVALRSITLRNEVPGTVRRVALVPGRVVEAGTVLVGLDVAVEEAELRAQQAEADLAATLLTRMQRMTESGAASANELDNARAERDVALAQVARIRAIIERKTIRAPFRARVGIADVHPGQYLNEGTQLTTLQGVDEGAYVDFTVAQQIAAALRKDGSVDIFAASDTEPVKAVIVAIDARVDRTTRNAAVRALIRDTDDAPAPGASVRVQVPVGAPVRAVSIPASALRKGPGGDHVFVLVQGEDGRTRAHERLVEVSAVLADEVVISKGLAAGERVAASGSFKLREAVLVAVTNASMAVAGGTGETSIKGSF